jgi:asparagine synthase (glutamine-hydrolysing)
MHDQEIVERFGELLRHSVSTACLGAQRIGISLSAGLDSSSIAAIAKRLPLARTDAIFGVTQGVDQFPDIDERALVGALAREIGIQHLSFSADRLLPYADAELHPVCPDSPSQSPFREWKEASAQMISAAGAEVYLSGDFADGLFSGGVEWVVDALRFQRWRLLGQQLTQQLRAQGLRATLADTAVRRPMSRALGRVAPHSERLDWLKRNYRDAIAERLRHEARAYSDFPRAQHCAQLLGAGAALDASAEHWFANRHGLEQRLPYRDLALTRWCLSLPADFFARNGQSKWLLRQSVCGLLPENLRLRRKSSDLTPVFEQAIKTQATTLAALCAAAGPIPGHYVRASAMQNLDPGYRTIASWLVSSFGSWLQSIDAKAASCATAVHTCPLTDDSLDGLLKGDR